ncbi:ATP-binding cassette domain-containing protein [Streptomyces luteocolor]|uniref:ATP-binding cassette domain-containing protein n=1 Tax=Streptomyces luteocolor TaxID=285500 RepID=UPI00085337C2|nr:ABC transporter ATP-binding protein [Streptomyces luteocolor]
MRPVLAHFLKVTGTRALRSLCLFLLVGAVIQGIAFALVVPITEDLLTPDADVPWAWIGVLAAVGVVYGVLHYLSVPMGNNLGAELVTTLHRSVAERVGKLPNRTLDAGYSDRLAALDGTAVVVLMGLPAHVLRPAVAAVFTPMTVIVISLFLDVRVALTLAAGLVVLGLASLLVGRLLSRREEPDGAEWLRRTYEQGGAAHSGGHLVPAAGEVLLWRVVELAACAAVGVAAALASDDGLSATKGVALIVLAVLTYRPMMEAVLLTSTIMNAREVMAGIGRLLGTHEQEGQRAAEPAAEWPGGTEVVFDGVGLRVEGTDVLADVSFEVPDGATTALVGTPDGPRLLLGDLLTGDVTPTSGQVRVGGTDVTALAPAVVERHIARVSPQAPVLTREEAARVLDSFPEESAERPGVRDALEGLRAAVERESDSAVALSERDRWRLALLRALRGDPSLVVVDATAGEDPFGADPRLAELFRTLAGGRACWLLTGTGGELPSCDRVVEATGTGATVRTPAVN